MSGNRARAAAPSKTVAHRPANVLNDALEPGAYRIGNLPQDYPQVVHPNDQRDTKYDLLRVIKPAATYEVTDKDVAYIEDKEKARQYAEFLAFMRTQFDMSDQAEAWIARQTFPDMFDGPQKYFDAMMDNVKTFTKINMRGAQSMDDYFFLWKLLTGTIHIPAGFTSDQLTTPHPIINDHLSDKSKFDVTKRGLFNPRRYIGSSQVPRAFVILGRDPANSANPFAEERDLTRGTGANNVNSLFGALAPQAVLGARQIVPTQLANVTR